MSVKITALLVDWNKKFVAQSTVLNNFEFNRLRDAKTLYQETNTNFWETPAGYNFINTRGNIPGFVDANIFKEEILSWSSCNDDLKELLSKDNKMITELSRWRKSNERVPYLIFVLEVKKEKFDFSYPAVEFKKVSYGYVEFNEDITRDIRKSIREKIYNELNGFFYCYQAEKPADWRKYFNKDNIIDNPDGSMTMKQFPDDAKIEMKLEREED